jgi:hypothetical protein
MRLELDVEEVRALSMVLSKRIADMNHEMSQAAMNGMQLSARRPGSSDLSHHSHSC